MSRALYSAVSGLKSHQTRMDVIANNIANVNTYGYKTSRVTFRDVFYQNLSTGAAPGAGGGQNPNQIGYGSMVGSIDTSTERSGYASTGYTMDCYINGEGYFKVTNSDGQDYYTRLGVFDFDSAGNLVDSMGNFVTGFEMKFSEDNGKITIEADDQAPIDIINLNNAKFIDENGAWVDVPEDNYPLGSISIDGYGNVSALDTEGNKVYVATIGVSNIDNPGGLVMQGNGYYTTGPNSGNAKEYPAGQGNTGGIVTGGLEMSGTDISSEFSDMILTQRGFQANSRIITTVDGMLEEVVNMVR